MRRGRETSKACGRPMVGKIPPAGRPGRPDHRLRRGLNALVASRRFPRPPPSARTSFYCDMYIYIYIYM